jgi:hypothetical protein
MGIVVEYKYDFVPSDADLGQGSLVEKHLIDSVGQTVHINLLQSPRYSAVAVAKGRGSAIGTAVMLRSPAAALWTDRPPAQRDYKFESNRQGNRVPGP